MAETQHLPVLVEEIVQLLGEIRGTAVDSTIGFGGHSAAILEAFPKARLIGLDQDGSALELAGKRLEKFGTRVELVHSNFANLKRELSKRSISDVAAIIADLGVSSMQMDSETRGFSFRYDAQLDMRMDESADIETAADILADRSETEIADLIYLYGEERFSRRIARRIVEARESGRPVETTKQLADLVLSSVPGRKKDAIHPATRTFQALRIAVNGELEILDDFLRDAVDVLKADGVLAVITFHSLEDRIVKNAFQRFAGKCVCPPKIPKCVCGAKKIAEIITKKPVVPSGEEMERNPRSRSAKLRAVKKIE